MAESEIRNVSGVHRFLRILGIIVSVGLALYALPILAAHWLLFLAMPFISFTFTDPPDFIFAGLLAWLVFVADPGRRFEWWLD